MTVLLEYQEQHFRVSVNGTKIGRGTDNDIIVPDEQASRHHAIVWETQGTTYIRDLGSTNGTFVNQRRITTAVPLRPGDQIQIGRATFIARAAGEIFSTPLQPVGAAVAPAPSRPSSSVGIVLAISGIGFVLVLVFGVAMFFSITGASPTVLAPTRIALPPSPMPAVTLSLVVPPTMPAVVPTQAIVASPTPDGMKRALLAVVYIEMPMDGGSNLGISGSGSIVDSRGFILTNYHVVRDGKSGKPYNSRDLIYVAVIGNDPSKPPDRIFRAQVIALNSKLDLALLKLSAQKDGSALPTGMNLTPIRVGDSDLVQINEEIRVIGFPDIGGNTVTASRGIVSGFLENRTWIKTDTEVNPGNSGGAAVNAAGELIGIPTRIVSDRTITGKIGYIRPINLAKEILAQIK